MGMFSVWMSITDICFQFALVFMDMFSVLDRREIVKEAPPTNIYTICIKMYYLGGDLKSVVCYRVTSTRGIQY